MKICSNCGSENDASNKFCMNCGAALPEEIQESPVAAAVAPQEEQPQYQQPIVQQPVQQPMQQPMQPQYQPQQQYQPQYQQPVQPQTINVTIPAPERTTTNGFCVAGFVISLISIITCGFTAFISLILSIIGLITASKKKQKGKGMGIAGIIISVILMIVASFICIAFWSGVSAFNDVLEDYEYEYEDDDDKDDEIDLDDIDIEDYIRDENWIENNDESYLVFDSSEDFHYYKEYGEEDDNYYIGTYEVYVGEDAYEYVTEDLAEYYVSEEDLDDTFARNEKYDLDNFICIVLNNDYAIVDGEYTEVDSKKTPYFGFFMVVDNEVALDIANMNTGTYFLFTPESQYEK